MDQNFLFLSLDLPQAPLYKDSQNQLVIPTISLFTLLVRPSPRLTWPSLAWHRECCGGGAHAQSCLALGIADVALFFFIAQEKFDGETSQELRGGLLRRFRYEILTEI